MKKCLFETARGAIGQANINAKEVKAFRIPVPPLEFQKIFADRIADLQSLITQQERHLAQAEALMQSLMSRSFRGECAGNEPSPIYATSQEENDFALAAEETAKYR
jgi:restriction endonuclease S subunit